MLSLLKSAANIGRQFVSAIKPSGRLVGKHEHMEGVLTMMVTFARFRLARRNDTKRSAGGARPLYANSSIVDTFSARTPRIVAAASAMSKMSAPNFSKWGFGVSNSDLKPAEKSHEFP